MKKFITSIFFVLFQLASNAQCSTVAVQISSSDTTYVQLYQAGFFNIPSGFANECEWEVTSFSGDLIHEESTSGGANEQSTVLFNHSIPITDSMKVTIIITNDVEGITCTMSDTLYWKETEILPGSFIGNWDVLSSNGGEEEEITNSTETILTVQNVELFPSPVYDYFQIKSGLDIYSMTIFNSNGQILIENKNVRLQERVDISNYPIGLYFVQFWNKNGRNLGTKKIIKK